jgi:simple sugar transport system permease protein
VLGVSQHVSGIGLTLLASGLAFLYLSADLRQPPRRPTSSVSSRAHPLLSEIRWSGPSSSPSPLTYLALASVPVIAFLLARPWGLDLRTSGENPRAADAAGSASGRCAPRRWSIGGR